MVGLNCLLTNSSARLVAKAMRNLSDIMIADNQNAKVTVKGLYKELKDAGIDIDLQSAAFIYGTEFFNDIQMYTNFQTEDEIRAFATVIPSVNKETKDALISAGYGKTLSNGKTILDWTKLMGKSEDEIKQEIKDKGLPNEDEVFDSLQKEWKQIISNAILKSNKKLIQVANPTDIQRKQRSAIDKIAEMYAMGINTQFGDAYKGAIRKYLGISDAREEAMNAIDEIAKQARELGKYGLSADNDIEQNMQKDINNLIAAARYADMNTFNKIIKGVSTAFDFATLRLLNNPGNLIENWLSGKGQSISDSSQYEKAPLFVRRAAKSKRSEIIKSGAADYGTEHNMFLGERNNVDHLREILASKIESEKGQKILNTAYNFVTGIWGLNAMDSRFKLQATWQRFIDSTTRLYMDKTGSTQKEADKWLNEQVTGESYEKAQEKAKEIIADLKSKGYKIEMSQNQINLLTADVIKAQILNNSIITKEQLETAFSVAYNAAGRSMGHVPNNYFSVMLSALKLDMHNAIKKAVKENNQNELAFYSLADILVNKMAMRFLGGGSNWIVLQLEKTGVGVIGGTIGLFKYRDVSSKLKHLSDYENSELKDILYKNQKNNDRIYRGMNFGLMNASALLLAFVAWGALSGDDKKKYVTYVEKNKWINKYVNKLLPAWLAMYNAYQMDKYKNKALDDKQYLSSYFWQNLLGQKSGEEDKVKRMAEKVYHVMNDKTASQQKKEEAMGQAGQFFGSYFNVDVIPMGKFYKDAVDIYEQSNTLISNKPKAPRGFLEGYENNTILRSSYEKNAK